MKKRYKKTIRGKDKKGEGKIKAKSTNKVDGNNSFPIIKKKQMKGFALFPENINRTGLNKGSGWRKKTLELMEKNCIELTIIDSEGRRKKLYSKKLEGMEGSGKNARPMSVLETIIAAQAAKAFEGEVRSAEFLRDTAGEKPSLVIAEEEPEPDEFDLSELNKDEFETFKKLSKKIYKGKIKEDTDDEGDEDVK